MKKNLILVFCVLLELSWFMAVSETVNNPKKMREHLENAAELEAQGIFVDAVAEYEKALEYQPGNVEICLKMAQAYLQMGKGKKFISICKETAEANQEDVSALDCLMEYYMEQNSKASAVKYLQDFTDRYPKNENAARWLAQLKGSYREISCSYEDIVRIHKGSMAVVRDGRYGVADALGAEILEPEYDEAYPFSRDGLALVSRDGRYIYVDRDGQTRLVVDGVYSSPGMMSSERTVASVDGKYGYLDGKLQPVTEFIWDDLTLISNSVGACRMGGKWALINKSGEVRTEYVYEDVIVDEYGFCAGQGRIFVREQGKYHLIDRNGEGVGELTFDDARLFPEEGYAAVCSDGKWGFLDKDGKLVIDFQYDLAQSFSHGFAAVCVDGKWGYVDEGGNMVIEPQFDAATAFSEAGTAAVKREKWKLIQLNIFL